jgi:hypothetical protein
MNDQVPCSGIARDAFVLVLGSEVGNGMHRRGMCHEHCFGGGWVVGASKAK